MSDVEVRPLSRLPAPCRGRPARPPIARDGASPPRSGAAPADPAVRYTSAAMQITTTPAPKSTILVEVEVPAERLAQAVGEATRALSRRTKVPGFRPGKAPRGVLEAVLGHGAVLEEAVDRLVQSAYRDALIEKEILPLTNADVEIVQAEEGKPLIFKATVPIRPEVQLGDYTQLQLPARDRDDRRRRRSTRSSRSCATRTPRSRRSRIAARRRATTRSSSTRAPATASPFEGGSAERMPLIIGEDRLIPGFEDELVGLKVGDTKGFDITFPADYGEETLAGQQAHFEVELRELREKILPDADDDFARSMGDFTDLANLREEVKKRLERNALDKARHTFSDQIIEYAVANATIDLPDVLVEQEVEVMHDEFRERARPAGDQRRGLRQGLRQEPRGPPRRLPARRREAGQGAPRPQQDRRGREPRRSPTPTSTPRSPRAASATPATRSSRSTSTASAAGTTSARPCAAAGSSRSSSTTGWPRTPSIRRSRTSRTARRHVDDDQARSVGRGRRDGSGLDPRGRATHDHGDHDHDRRPRRSRPRRRSGRRDRPSAG